MSRGGYGALGWLGGIVFMWIPGVTSLVCRLIFHEGFRDVGWGWRNWKATLATIWTPIFARGVVYAILWGSRLSPHNGEWPFYLT